jgi:hypothetical protein
VDTAEIGVAGAGLTNINLPNQTMDIVGNITGNLSGSVGSVAADGITAASLAADAGTEIATAVGALTLTELGAITSASPSLKDALALQHMALRNRRETTATADTIRNDAGTTIATATLSDDATTFVKTEYV